MGLFDRSSSSTTNLTENINAPNTIQDSEGAIIAGGDVYHVSTDFNALDNASRLASAALDAGNSIARDAVFGAQDSIKLGNNLAADLGTGAYNLVGDIADYNNKLASRALDTGEYSSGIVSDIASQFGNFAQSTTRDVIDAASGSASQFGDFAQSVNRDVIDAASNAIDKNASLAANFSDTAERVYSGFTSQTSKLVDTSLSFATDLQQKFQNTIASTVDALQRIGVEQNKSTDQRLAESSDRTLKYALIGLGIMALGLAYAASKR